MIWERHAVECRVNIDGISEATVTHNDLPEGVEFERLLHADVVKMNHFYERQLASLRARFKDLLQQVRIRSDLYVSLRVKVNLNVSL